METIQEVSKVIKAVVMVPETQELAAGLGAEVAFWSRSENRADQIADGEDMGQEGKTGVMSNSTVFSPSSQKGRALINWDGGKYRSAGEE